MLADVEQQLRPAEKDRIGKMLAVVAQMIGAPIPTPNVIAMYIGFLSEYPQDLIDEMGTYVIRHHKFNTYPRVADFEEPVRQTMLNRKRALKETLQARKDYLGTE
jgi:hypothetical protein